METIDITITIPDTSQEDLNNIKQVSSRGLYWTPRSEKTIRNIGEDSCLRTLFTATIPQLKNHDPHTAEVGELTKQYVSSFIGIRHYGVERSLGHERMALNTMQ